ncbi:conserved hypothetical protein [Leishmania major strain Friedlin]|uniref:Uncharacterized protein n=1 Tax=Leishmania major TaxID=5664 RepID=Q4QC76_LEIMA|nr:conserved hypothetical protein [Leishmania major strain Friedlin]CAG9573508.1 hypothetical_protein_-_conserved [Leishmania major strain Friedlin]CAJ04630.1 conserved hypothetical protein [Leishmania major strain Friedlin]|eukprot:XP_001683072.1 conserved hypothetical protein [Leishmania major strain Friedlin]
MSLIGGASHARLIAVRPPLVNVCRAPSGVSACVTFCIFAPHHWQHRAFVSVSTTARLLEPKKKRVSRATKQKPTKATSAPLPFYKSHSVRPVAAATSKTEGAAPPAAASFSTTASTASSVPDANIAAPAPMPAPSPPVAAQHAEQPRRSYAPTSAAISEQLASLRRELLETRLQLAKAEETYAGLYEGVLARLAETDRAAHLTASSLRYTGMALRAAHDNLEVELRRLLTIGLTAEEVDAAAIEAGARQYVRQNIGYHTEHVAAEPPAVPDMARVMEKNERRAAMSNFGKRPQ